MDGWDTVGETNWRVEDGAIVADKRRQGAAPSGHQELVQGLQIYVEFWASDNANSGIFVRCRPEEDHRPRPATRSTSSTRGRTRPTAPARSSISPRSTRCRRPAASGTRSRSPPRAGTSRVMLNGKKTVGAPQRHVRRGPLHAAVRRRRDQVPQGRGQATVTVFDARAGASATRASGLRATTSFAIVCLQS